MNLFNLILGTVFIICGLFFLIVAAVGVAKLPDIYCRSHAVGKAMTLGIILLLLSLGLLVETVAWWKIVLAISFQLATIPVASHLLCLIGYTRGIKRWSASGWVIDKPGKSF